MSDVLDSHALATLLREASKMGILVDCGIPSAERFLPDDDNMDLEASFPELHKHVRNGRVYPMYFFMKGGPILPHEPKLGDLPPQIKNRVLPDPECLFVSATFPFISVQAAWDASKNVYLEKILAQEDPFGFIATELSIPRQDAKKAIHTALYSDKFVVGSEKEHDLGLRTKFLDRFPLDTTTLHSIAGLRQRLRYKQTKLGLFILDSAKRLPSDTRILFTLEEGLCFSCPMQRIPELAHSLRESAEACDLLQMRIHYKTTYGSPGVI